MVVYLKFCLASKIMIQNEKVTIFNSVSNQFNLLHFVGMFKTKKRIKNYKGFHQFCMKNEILKF